MLDIKKIIDKTLNLKLLYVEDNKDARESTFDVFEIFFKDIDVAINGEDGLQKCINKKYDLIITDITMPKENGTQMIKKIRELSIDVPILVFSAHNEIKYMRSIENININYYLPKPLSLDQLLEALDRVV